MVDVGSTVTWTYRITNTGTVTLTNITLVDDKIGNVTASCPITTLAAGAATTCTMTGIATAGLYKNTAVVTGTSVLSPTDQVTSTNPSHYFGGNPQVEDENCYVGVNSPLVGATQSWVMDYATRTVRIRTTFAKTFVDNTYGTGAVGWAQWSHLRQSDGVGPAHAGVV